MFMVVKSPIARNVNTPFALTVNAPDTARPVVANQDHHDPEKGLWNRARVGFSFQVFIESY
jgi:hypothetical protein